MRNAGITLILAGVALIGAIGLDATKSNTSSRDVIEAGLVTRREVTSIRFFSTVSTVLIILGIGATVVGKNEK